MAKPKTQRPSTKPPSGTRDFLAADVARRRHVVRVIEAAYEAHGFSPLETPAFENLSTLLGKYGDEGDQLLYRLLHRRDTLKRALDKDSVGEADLADQGLRYDLTVPLARVVAQYRDLPRFYKRYQIQPVWRADRPGRGRFREFYQCDVDVVGTQSPIAESEICSALSSALQALGFENFSIHINHRQLLKALIAASGIARELEQTALVALDKLDKIGEQGVLDELAQRELSVQSAKRLTQLAQAAVSGDNTERLRGLEGELKGEGGRTALAELRELLRILAATPASGRVIFDPSLARGLSYYTGPIFEIRAPQLAGSLGGGGRYDGLIGMFGKQPIPAVGASLGLERILLLMQEQEMFPQLSVGPQVLLCWFDIEPAAVVGVAARLRQAGFKVEVYPQAAKLGKQLQYADSPGVKAPVAAIIGEDEAKSGQITLKRLDSGEQVTEEQAAAIDRLRAWLS